MGSVRKRGKKWYYSFEMPAVNGKRKRVERVGGDTKKEALAALRKAEDEIERTGAYLDETDMSFADYLDIWFEKYVRRELASRSIEYYSYLIKNHIKPALGHYKLKNISSLTLQDFLESKKTYGLSRSSVNNMKGVLNAAFRYAVVPAQLIKVNPMLNVKMPNFNTYKDKSEKIDSIETTSVLNEGEIEAIFNRFKEDSNMYLPIRIAYHTGMRGGEVCALQWSDVDLEKKTISVKRNMVDRGKGIFELGPTKTEKSTRTIKIGDTLASILKKRKIRQNENKLYYGIHYNMNDFVCKKENGTPITTNSIKYISRVVNHELKIRFHFHMFRHTHATMLVRAGADYKDIQERLGHSNIETTMNTYARTSESLRQDTVDKFENIIKAL